MHGLGVYTRGHPSLDREVSISLESQDHAHLCVRLSILNSRSYLFFPYRSPSSQVGGALDSITDNIDKSISLHPSGNIFLFGDINAHRTK